jgi:hypothetical protein
MGEGLERRHRREVDRNLFSEAVRRRTANDLDVETRKVRGGFVESTSLWGMASLEPDTATLRLNALGHS